MLKPMEVIGIIAIIVAPVAAFLLPEKIADQVVTSNTSIKDLVLLVCVLTLGAILFVSRAAAFLFAYVRSKPFYENVELTYFYLPDGTVVSRMRFDLVNGWSETADAPEEHLVWHKQIDDSDLVYRLYARRRFGDARIAEERSNIELVKSGTDPAPNVVSDFRFSWRPKLAPPMAKKERLAYVVEIVAEKTETAAFGEAGTKLGFGFDNPAAKARVTAYAPFGHRFVAIAPFGSVRTSKDLSEIPGSADGAPKPVVSPDGSQLVLSVTEPRPGRRYWAHYRFERVKQ